MLMMKMQVFETDIGALVGLDVYKRQVLCNPNNPTSSCINRTDMRRILDICKQYDIFVMVDETYVESVSYTHLSTECL